MKIVQLIPELNEGGVERGVVELSRELVKQGFESVVISNGGKLVEQLEKNGSLHVKLDVCSKNIVSAPWRIVKLYFALKNIKPDLVHVRSRVPAWMVFFANKCLHFPVISTVHGFNSVNKYSAIMVKADQIICASSFLVEHIVKHFHANPTKIHIIPRGIDFNYFNTEALDTQFIEAFKQEHHLAHKRVIFHVARITHWKDQATTIRAFLELRSQRNDIKLFFAGGIDPKRVSYYEELQTLVTNSEYAEDIVFLGSQSKMKELYTLADLTISASTKPETFGRANVESLAMGVPLLATPIGATKDYVIEGQTGFFFEPKNHHELAKLMQKSLSDYSFNRELIKVFAKTHFSLDQMVDKNVAIYRTFE